MSASIVGDAPAAEMPTATGPFGEKPVLTFPNSPPPPGVQRQFLVEGTGPPVADGDLVIENHHLAIWGSGAVIDSSYDMGLPMSRRMGIGQPPGGWDLGLSGVPVGSRILLTMSPSNGYGTAGIPDIGITGTDTLVLVLDVLNSLGHNQFGQADAVVQPTPEDAPVVTGHPGSEPSLTIPPGLPEPTAPKADILALGSGAPVGNGLLYMQYALRYWSDYLNENFATWTSRGPEEIAFDESSKLQALRGVPVGSRVLIQLPTEENNGSPASAFVVDILYYVPV